MKIHVVEIFSVYNTVLIAMWQHKRTYGKVEVSWSVMWRHCL